MQPGPWDKNGSQVVDTDGNTIMLSGVGLAMRTIGPFSDDQDVIDNTKLLTVAPTQNHLIGEIIDIMDNPYTTDSERVGELYNVLELLRENYINGENYESDEK